MAAVRSNNTSPELRVRYALHSLGVRYRLDQTIALGGRKVRPDLVFRGARVALFVDGCFWHGCETHCRMPSSNVGYWNSKIDRNRARDRSVDEILGQNGWTVMRIWEHEDPMVAALSLRRVLEVRAPNRANR